MKRRNFSGTLTIRLDERSARSVRRKARAKKQTASEYVRSLIASDVSTDADEGPTLYQKSKRWVGAIKSGPPTNASREREILAAWKPDRRG